MFLFNLFEKKKQDTAASRFVGGTSQDARVKNALDNAYRAVPAAKSPEEAALGYIDIQNSLNQKQDQALDQQTKTNQQQTQQINDLVSDMRRKEKDFRDLNAQIASMPNVTPQQVAQMAQDIEAAHDSEKGQPVDVSNVVNKRVASQASEPQQRTVYAPGPGASISQQANYQKAKDQGAATANTQPTATQATTQPTTSRALGQMASQLATPGRVIKGKNQQAQQADQTQQPAQQELPPGVVDFAQQKSNRGAKVAGIQLDQPAPEAGQKVAEDQAPAGSDPTSIAKYNIEQLSKAYMSDARSVDMEFPTGQGLALQNAQIHALVDLLSNLPDGANKQALLVNLFSNRNFLIEWMFENILNKPVQATQQSDPGQLEMNEGDVIPMTGSPSVPGNVKAYQYALEILKAAFDERVPTAKIDQMKQMLFHDFQARIQQAPDGTYYLNINGAKTRLPDPRTFPMEEDAWHAGDNSWSSEHDQWARESTNPASPKDTIQRYLAIDKQTDVEAVKAAIHAISSDTALKPESKSRYLGYIGMIINRHRLPIGRDYYQFMQKFMESQDTAEGIDDLKKKMSKFEALALVANRAGDDAKCKMYQQKVQSLKQKLSQSMTEELGHSPVAGAITRRILMQRLDLLKQYGPELVGAAVDNVADYVGDVDEIGSSDVSGWVMQVERMLKENPPEAFGEGWSDAMVARRTGQPRTPYSVYIKGKKWKDFENDDHARAVMDKLKAKFKADGRDPETITIAPTDMSESISKKDLVGQLQKDLPTVTNPKNKNARPVAWTGPGKDDYGYTGYQGHGMPTDRQERDRIRADKKKGVAEAEGEYKVYYMTAEDHKLMGRYASREEAEQRLNQLQSEYPDNKFIIWKNSKQGVAEGLIYSGDTWQDVLYRINVLNDIFGDQRDLTASFEPASQPEWGPFRDRILRSRTVLDTYAKVKQLANMNVPLTDVEIEMLDDVAWDGGGGPVEPAGHWGERDYDWLEDLYAQQFAVVQHLLDQRAQGRGQNKTKSGQTVHEQGVAEAEKKGLYYNVNKRKAAGTSRPANDPKAPTAQAWKDAAKTAKKESVAEAETDYSKRRQRERDVDAGKPVARQPKNPQNDYFARRKKEKKHDMAEATGDSRFDSMMNRISNDPWTRLNADPNWEYEIEELVDQQIEPWLLAMEKSGMPITRDEETLNPGWRKRYEQIANQLAQKYLTSKGMNPRDPDLLGKIRYAIDWHTDESKNVHGQLSAYSELPMQRYASAFDADGMTANMRDAMSGVGSRDDDNDDDGYAPRPRPGADPRRLDPGNMEESSKPGEYYIHTVYFKDGTKKRIRVTSDEVDVADYYTKRGKAVDRVDYDFQIHSNVTEQSVLPGIPLKSVIQGYTVFYNPQTREISVTRGGHSAEAAIEQTRISQPTMLAFRSAVDRMINKIDNKTESGINEGTINYWTKLQNERNTKIASLVNELEESIEKK